MKPIDFDVLRGSLEEICGELKNLGDVEAAHALGIMAMEMVGDDTVPATMFVMGAMFALAHYRKLERPVWVIFKTSMLISLDLLERKGAEGVDISGVLASMKA